MAILPDYGPVRAETGMIFLKSQNITYVHFVGLICNNYTTMQRMKNVKQITYSSIKFLSYQHILPADI